MDLVGGRVSALDVPADDVVKLSESVMDSLRSMGLPLWTVGRTRDGDVLVKHLFEDIVYRYDRSGSTPMYQVADAGGIKCSAFERKEANLADRYVAVRERSVDSEI